MLEEVVVGPVGLGAARAAGGVVALRERELVVVEGALAVPLVEPCPRLGHDAREDRLDVVGARCGRPGEASRAVFVLAVGPVQEQAVKVQVRPQVGREPLHHDDRAAARGAQAALGSEPAVALLDRIHGDAREGAGQLVVEGGPPAQVER
ncbi:MAG: hypothetical protein M5U28_16480 [Sandaracinaceae bacterium]|nr:hypothetical protein [Sandaracinaceae bacterium]